MPLVYIDAIAWRGYNLDLNPIEHIWGRLKDTINQKESLKAITREVGEHHHGLLYNFISSMPETN